MFELSTRSIHELAAVVAMFDSEVVRRPGPRRRSSTGVV